MTFEAVECPQCHQYFSPGTVHYPHNRTDGTRCVFIRVFKLRFFPEDVYEGDIDYSDTIEEIVDCLPEDGTDDTIVSLAVDGLPCGEPSEMPGFSPGLWYSDPDGSQTVDYYTGEREEISGHLYGFTDQEQLEVWQQVTGKTAEEVSSNATP
jgi:hypothetical protein